MCNALLYFVTGLTICKAETLLLIFALVTLVEGEEDWCFGDTNDANLANLFFGK